MYVLAAQNSNTTCVTRMGDDRYRLWAQECPLWMFHAAGGGAKGAKLEYPHGTVTQLNMLQLST